MKPQMDNGHLPQRGGTPLRVCPKPFGHAARTDTLRVCLAARFALTPVASGGKAVIRTGLTARQCPPDKHR